MSHTLVIAEIGSCHDRSIARAMDLVDTAAICGADAVKVQYWSSAERLAARRQAPAYLSIYQDYAMPLLWLPVLAKRAALRGIEFLCTAYLPEDVDAIVPHVRRIKIASFEAGDAELAHAVRARLSIVPTIISCGMGAKATGRLTALWGTVNTSFLHCVSAYPAPTDQLELARIRHYDGYSDHASPDLTWTGALAVASGAKILERHLRSDFTTVDNPDYPHAMTPLAFGEYVRHVRFAEVACGDRTHMGPVPAEAPMLPYRVIA